MHFLKIPKNIIIPRRAERQRTIYSYAYNDILKTQNLCKIYKNNKIVVNRLAFSVSPGGYNDRVSDQVTGGLKKEQVVKQLAFF